MALIKSVHILCGTCNTRFPSPLFIGDTESFESAATFGNATDCPNCGALIRCNKENMSYVLADSSAGAVGPEFIDNVVENHAGSSLNRVAGKRFENAEIPMCGHGYRGCTFVQCLFVYDASGPTEFFDNNVDDACKIALQGSARDTLEFMRGMYRLGDWGRDVIDTAIKFDPPPTRRPRTS